MAESVEAEDSSAGLVVPLGSASLTHSCTDPRRASEEALEGAAAGGECGEEGTEGGGDNCDGGRAGPLGLLGLAGTCCVCIEMEQVRSCLRSEKICILPILACLLSLALCTAGLKWVFVDKIFEYEPPTHLDPDRMEQNPFIIISDPTRDLPVSFPYPSPVPMPTTTTTGQPEVIVEGKPTGGPFIPQSPRVTQYSPTSALMYPTDPPTQPGPPNTPKPVKKGTPTPHTQTTVESNDVVLPKFSATSTTAVVKTSSHMTRCSDNQKNYCVNGGECFTLDITPGRSKFLCRCPNEFTGDRCQNYVMASFYKAEELYQKRVLTITGICIALLVVGIMCVVAYCKTKKQRKKLHGLLRQSLRNERNTMASMANGPPMYNPSLENVQFVNHLLVKETEMPFSTSQYTSSVHQSTTVTHTSSQSWSNCRSESAFSHSCSVLVMSSMENSRHATPIHRGRLDATGGARDPSVYLKNTRDTPDSSRDSPFRDRYASAMTTPTRLSPVELLSPVTPPSPPSEISSPQSSLATSVPSVAVSPTGEEEDRLLFTTTLWPRDKPPRPDHHHSQSKRNCAHYNYGHKAHSPPPSPLRIVENDSYETTQECEAIAATVVVPTVPPQSLPKKLTNNNKGRCANSTKPNGHTAGHKTESNDRVSSTARSSSESDTEEDYRMGEDTPFLSLQDYMAAGVEPLTDSYRTYPARRLSPQDDLQARLSSIIANQDPIAV
ncbi:pro-neuregulin-1, membrane-bound isoform-like isoform X1 [Oncorhynchus keta]|uniref:pro-neuregulin-1, membrane-bound isoform-like isoform X1 n=2 Tax=Oncorhynchus keta TaxID=8018 RepID=UPI0015FD1F22|nr:pro-neuregulin-1, membrane-bound isoform-like isoform X1 [Oncorhynchus keta]